MFFSRETAAEGSTWGSFGGLRRGFVIFDLRRWSFSGVERSVVLPLAVSTHVGGCKYIYTYMFMYLSLRI